MRKDKVALRKVEKELKDQHAEVQKTRTVLIDQVLNELLDKKLTFEEASGKILLLLNVIEYRTALAFKDSQDKTPNENE